MWPYIHTTCVCVFFPFILDIKFVGRTSRGHTGGRSHRTFHPPSFCGACLNFSREKDPAIPFPRRPWSRILCTNDLIVLHPLGIFIFVLQFFSEKNPFCRDRTHVPTCQRVTRYLWATEATGCHTTILIVVTSYIKYRIQYPLMSRMNGRKTHTHTRAQCSFPPTVYYTEQYDARSNRHFACVCCHHLMELVAPIMIILYTV